MGSTAATRRARSPYVRATLATALLLQSRYVALPFKPRADLEAWKASIDGKVRPLLQGNRLMLRSEAEAGAVVVKRGAAEVWQGRLEKGALVAKPGFLFADLILDGATAGMTGQPLPGTVPYLQTDAGADYHPDKAACAEKQVKWRLPVGTYRLQIDGFEPTGEVTVPSDRPVSALTLKAISAPFALTLAETIRPEDLLSCVLVAEDVPQYKLNPRTGTGVRPAQVQPPGLGAAGHVLAAGCLAQAGGGRGRLLAGGVACASTGDRHAGSEPRRLCPPACSRPLRCAASAAT